MNLPKEPLFVITQSQLQQLLDWLGDAPYRVSEQPIALVRKVYAEQKLEVSDQPPPIDSALDALKIVPKD